MGAALEYNVYEDNDRKDIDDEFRVDCDQARYMNGHGGYTGTIAEMYYIEQWVDLNAADQRQAISYLSDNHKKWDNAMAVSYIKEDKKYWVVGGWCSS